MVKAFVFDAYGTLFDVHSVKEECNKWFPEKGDAISTTWREKQLNYFFLRQLMERYEPFDQITRESLKYACKANGAQLTEESEQALMEAYLNLELFEEVGEILSQLNDKRLVVFSNGSPGMIDPLVGRSDISGNIDEVLSADGIKQYKPVPAAYYYAQQELELEKEEILFMSSNPWDITGASSYGFHTAWINRKGLQREEFDIQPEVEYDDLKGLLEWK
ncbi:haloacid dehalogenase type II [Salimicrobium salexigens]|uniref:2-haloacid dehalogenase n=1 Tax=Salimicrobium salexigens TaxID=908941 RepID=A0ABY1KKK9_9BACI|nr:haloacid dehalogenase type II [Salimicrobium salexigens]SIS45886.1 2-haloacid dehalogenase [Salimicrobium salexigens]